MANALITPTIITKEFLMHLENNLVMGQSVSRAEEDEFEKIGDTLKIRKPVRFTSKSGPNYVAEDVEEASHDLVQLQQQHVDFEFPSRDLTLTIERFGNRYLMPAAITLAQFIETTLHEQYKKIYNFVGTPGTTPSSFLDLGAAMVNLDEHGVPVPERWASLNPDATLQISNDLKSLNQNDAKARKAFEEALMGRYATFKAMSSQSVVSHEVGALGGTPVINGAAQNVTYLASKNTWTQSLVIDGASTSITDWALEGDVFTLVNVFSVNPITRQSTGKLQDFVVRADADSDGSGNVTLTISPPIITSGPYQTVDSVPADGVALTFAGTAGQQYPQNITYHSRAFSLAMVDLEVPDGVEFAASERHRNMSARVIKQYDISDDTMKCRLDIQFAADLVHHLLACRLTG